MSNLNKIRLIGNIGFIRDVRKTFDGNNLTNLSMACNRKYKKKIIQNGFT